MAEDLINLNTSRKSTQVPKCPSVYAKSEGEAIVKVPMVILNVLFSSEHSEV